MTMTHEQWNALGLEATNASYGMSCYRMFRFRYFETFEVRAGRLFGVTSRGGSMALGQFKDEAKAKLVALTLEIINPERRRP